MAPRGVVPPALVAPLLALLPRAMAADDPCECLNWKEVYATKRVLCGEGYEFAWDFPWGRPKSYEEAYFLRGMGFTYHEFCASFFERMDNNYCVNIKHHPYGDYDIFTHQWCYVSRKCQNLNGGIMILDKDSIPELPSWLSGPTAYSWAKTFHWPRTIPRDISIKLCASGRDAMLGEMPPQAVVDLARSMDSVVGFVTKSAYPMAKQSDHRSPIWDDVKDAVAEGNISKMPDVVRRAVVERRPIVVDVDPEGHTHQRILVGEEVYELENRCDQYDCGATRWPFRRARDIGEL